MRSHSSIPPSLCGNFLRNKRSLLAFTWTITTVLTLFAFILAMVMSIHEHVYYKGVERYYEEKAYEYQQLYESASQQEPEGEKGGEGGEQHNNNNNKYEEMYKEFETLIQLSQVSSGSMTFCALYTMSMAVALALYGSTAIVGFMSLQGVYIAPCFSSPSSSRLKVGMFGGAIVFFANLLLLCAVIFGEVRVEDYQDRRDGQDEREPYEVERIATILAVTCMFLSALYTIFAILLFLYYGSEDRAMELETDGVVSKPLSSIRTHDPRRENFITMGESN